MPDAFADLAPRMDFRLPLLLAMLLLLIELKNLLLHILP